MCARGADAIDMDLEAGVHYKPRPVKWLATSTAMIFRFSDGAMQVLWSALITGVRVCLTRVFQGVVSGRFPGVSVFSHSSPGTSRHNPHEIGRQVSQQRDPLLVLMTCPQLNCGSWGPSNHHGGWFGKTT